jgi:hypothetical protein
VQDAVTHATQSAGRTRVLHAHLEYAGARLELVGYGRIPAPVAVGAAA